VIRIRARAADFSLRGGSGVDNAGLRFPRGLKPAAQRQFDAFGNDMSKPLSSTGSFAWRGQEGSVTDRASGLVYMQARHYDPSIGRFIQADVLPMASLTTQGMNRYIYCENDPVNASDPSGTFAWLVLFAFLAGAALGAGLATLLASQGLSLGEWLLRAGLLTSSRRLAVTPACNLAFKAIDKRLTALLLEGLIAPGAYASLLMRTGLGILGGAFLAGFMLGFAFTSLLLMTDASRNADDEYRPRRLTPNTEGKPRLADKSNGGRKQLDRRGWRLRLAGASGPRGLLDC